MNTEPRHAGPFSRYVGMLKAKQQDHEANLAQDPSIIAASVGLLVAGTLTQNEILTSTLALNNAAHTGLALKTLQRVQMEEQALYLIREAQPHILFFLDEFIYSLQSQNGFRPEMFDLLPKIDPHDPTCSIDSLITSANNNDLFLTDISGNGDETVFFSFRSGPDKIDRHIFFQLAWNKKANKPIAAEVVRFKEWQNDPRNPTNRLQAQALKEGHAIFVFTEPGRSLLAHSNDLPENLSLTEENGSIFLNIDPQIRQSQLLRSTRVPLECGGELHTLQGQAFDYFLGQVDNGIVYRGSCQTILGPMEKAA